MEVPHILQSFDLQTSELIPSVSERYYEHKYCVKFSTIKNNYDQRVSFHSNKICLISLAENHVVMKGNKKIKKINCNVSGSDRLANMISGKGKRGAQKLEPDSILCFIECEDDICYPVYSCVKGKLLEINENLLENPNLLIQKPTSEGYIALVLPILNLHDKVKNSMLPHDQYESIAHE